MSRSRHIDDILSRWPYEPNRVSVRLVDGNDGRKVIQMRVDMGLLQLETTGRPDGTRPEGAETYYDHLRSLELHEGDDFVLSEEQCSEIDRELVQFYHRRVCWLAMRRYEKAVADADHTLGLMDFCGKHSSDRQWVLSHEQYRPFVMFHRAQATALAALEASGPEAAIRAINGDLDRFRALFAEYDAQDEFDDHELVKRLLEMREAIRGKFDVGRTLHEQLAEAVAREQYELAAIIRDELAQRQRPGC